ncbi:MAG: hypothetical protein AB7P14_29885 [Blastocatellales bacterium]
MSIKKTTLVVSVFAFLCLITVFTLKVKSKQAYEKAQLTVDIKQLSSKGGIIPVEVHSAKIQLSAPNEIESYSCVVKNNTTQAITALALEWTFIADNNGKPTRLTGYSGMDAIYHPDIQNYRQSRSLAPGGEITMDSSSTTAVPPPALMVKAEVSLVYVEFDDKTIIDLDPKHYSLKTTNEQREGAERCKQWLVKLYRQQSKNIESILPLLKSESFPAELRLDTHHLHHGAKMYGKFIISLYAKNQTEVIDRYLGQ